MGEVCLAEDLILQRQLALKFFTAPGAHEGVDQLLAEARAAAALDHPFICAIYEVTTFDGRPCIAMEFVRGETLERRLRRGPLPLAEALRIAEEIAEALEAAHKRRVIHRDLKPANVMLTDDHHIKVMDFGLAARLAAADDDPERTLLKLPADDGEIRGTPAYMAPEQIRGEPTDRRSDIFSFGVLLYQLLSGVNPFLRTGVEATLTAILSDAPDLSAQLPAVPPALAACLARMLAKEPSARQQTFGQVRAELRKVAAELTGPVLASPAVATRLPSPDSTAVVGRETERAQLLHGINQALAKSGTLIGVSGEAGIGKTRLVEEALERARHSGCQTLLGRCYEQDGTPPLIPYIEVLEAASRLLPAAVFREAIRPCAPELAKLLPELHRLFPDMAPPLELPPELRQRFLFTNVRDFLARASQIAPIVIALDDLQWADPSTLQLTHYLAQQIPTLPIVIVASYRDADSTGAVSRGALQNLFDRVRAPVRDSTASARVSINQLATQGLARLIALRPLTEPDTRTILSALAQQVAPPAIVRRFLKRTGGNPFFLTELFRHLKEEGRLFDTDNRWSRQIDLDELELPESVRAVMERRLQHVSRETLNVLRAAAIMGSQFELDLLEAAVDVDEDTLLSALEEAETAHLLKGPSGRQDVTWRFTHDLIGQALTHGIPTVRRQRMHLRTAVAMQRFHTAARPYTSEIAHHLYAAGRAADPHQTTQALMTAGDIAHSVYATDEAIRHYRRALEVIGEARGEERTRLRVQEGLADLLALSGERAGAMQHYHSLDASFTGRDNRIDRARVARKIGALHWQAGNRAEAMSCYERALQMLDNSGASVEAAHLYQELGLAAFRSGDNHQAIDWSERSLRAAEETMVNRTEASARKDATRAIAHATNTIGVAMARLGELSAARERIERSVAAANELGLLDVACRAYANLGVLYSTVEPQRAIDVSLTGLELASKIGAASLQSYIYANLAAAYCALTDDCEAEGLEAAHAAANLDRQLGQLDHLAVPLIVIAQIHQCRGDLAEAHRHYTEALTLAEKVGEPQLILPCYDGLATISLDRGDRKTAGEYMERARELSEKTGIDPDTLLLLPFLS
jgi:adenylate cyclase